MHQVLKFLLKPGLNTITIAENHTARLVYLNDQDGKIMGWVELTQTADMPQTEYEVYLALTGEQVPDEYRYITSHQVAAGGGYFVTHAYD